VNIDYPHIEYKPQISKGKNDKYLYYVVSNSDKKSFPDYREHFKAMRAREIVDTIDDVLKHISNTYCKKDYEVYLRKAKQFYDSEIEERRSRIRNIGTNTRNNEDEVNNLTL
jgi:hypothetical protein